MLGFFTFLSVLGIVGTIGGVVCIFVTRYKTHAIIGAFISLFFSICMFNYIYTHEEKYYMDHGDPKAQFGQVHSISGKRIAIYYDRSNTNLSNFTAYDPKSLKGLKEGDVVKVFYVDGIYRSFALDIQKFVPER